MIRMAAAFAFVAIASSGMAEAAPCQAPETPHFTQARPRTPNKPECLANPAGCDRHVASQYDFDMKKFQEETRLYRDASSAYLSQLRTYLNQAQDFVQCEAQKL
jgi:hypothetical protein